MNSWKCKIKSIHNSWLICLVTHLTYCDERIQYLFNEVVVYYFWKYWNNSVEMPTKPHLEWVDSRHFGDFYMTISEFLVPWLIGKAKPSCMISRNFLVDLIYLNCQENITVTFLSYIRFEYDMDYLHVFLCIHLYIRLELKMDFYIVSTYFNFTFTSSSTWIFYNHLHIFHLYILLKLNMDIFFHCVHIYHLYIHLELDNDMDIFQWSPHKKTQ